ncbi:sialate O-acetylesterase [Pelagicoccus albus]|uniref:Sialate O-acetylesterase domain-containing protein n=1 Tax=Pelagicoccus albus TaxID=415222 RepID=A0A7X1B9B0_9BACT|nr:sialate O-acetylesterase [Pelagicoccus albus]MBC2608065.1 hypothetical protein [Pelagicoccus albus]
MKTSLALLSIALSVVSAQAEIEVASPFGSHMVLQREASVPVWGTADAGETVEVTFAGQTVSATADSAGAWNVSLEDLKTSAEGRELTVSGSSSGESIVFEDVLVGEVWLCGGQSNMERQLGPRPGQKEIVGWESEAAAANYPLVRELYVKQARSLTPLTEADAEWRVCTPETVVDFTAVGYFFARDLYQSLGVPVGIIHSSWGGTPAEAWTSREGLAEFPYFIEQVNDQLEFAGDPEVGQSKYLAKLEKWFEANDSLKVKDALEGSGIEWEPMTLPTMWEDAGYNGVDGICWFQKSFDLPKDFRGKDLLLELGAIDDSDTTWVNGHLVGAMSGWNTPREYVVSAKILKKGENVITVRALDTGGGGGIWNADEPLQISINGKSGSALDLKGEWKSHFSTVFDQGPRPPQDLSQSPGAPTVLFNAMIAPIAPYAVKGFTFYQGEANAGAAKVYESLLPALISDWRKQWSDEELPFLFVQIAPYEGMPPEIREAQRQALLATENTAMAVTIDIGDATDIHPAQKEPVGERLALAARALAYGEDLVYSGPEFQSWKADGSEARLTFDAHGDLVAPGGKLIGFEMAGEDGEFYPASAQIDGSSVVLKSDSVEKPTEVRYGWANVAKGNLFNDAGLPASPFTSGDY